MRCRLLPRRHAAVDRRGGHGAATATTGWRPLTLLAAQTDFTEPGELTLFIDDSQLAFLEDMMWKQGFLDSKPDGGRVPDAALERPDLVAHGPRLPDGRAQPMIDLMAWNADATRMPYRMHSEYLRQLFLNNDLAEGRYLSRAARRADATSRVRCSSVGTETDHVAPWRSVYKIHRSSAIPTSLPADERRTQCRHRIRAGPQEPRLPGRHGKARRSLHRPGNLAATEQAGAGVLVAGVGEVAQGRIERVRRAAANRRPRGRLYANLRRARDLRFRVKYSPNSKRRA